MSAAIWLACRSCGGMVGVTVATPDVSKDHIARFVADGARRDLRIENTTCEAVRRGDHPWCSCDRRASQGELLLAGGPS